MPYVLNNGQSMPITLAPAQEIGSGGMGVAYRIGNLFGTGNLVAKIFKNPHDPKNPSRQKLEAMIARPPEHVYEVINGVGYTQFAWIQHLIVDDNGQVIGYAMPELDFDRSISLNPFMYPREAQRLTDYQKSLNYRVQLCANISALMSDLHSHGHAFIDFKEQNLRLMPEPKTGVDDDYKGFIVGFIDCDSYRITDAQGHVYPSPVISPEMTSPEYHEHHDISRLDQRHDRFVLAIELFKILNNGIHPFYFIPLSDRLKNLASRDTDKFIKERLYAYGLQPHPEIAPLKNSIHQCWDDATRAMFDKAFLSRNPDERPTAEQWEQHFRALSRNRQFVVCDNFPNDASHIHFVGKPCHRCLLENTANMAANPHIEPRQYPNSPYGGITNEATPNTPPAPESTNQSVWKSAPTDQPNPVPQPASAPSATTSTPVDLQALEDNRRREQSLNATRTPPVFSAPVSPAPAPEPVPAQATPVAPTVSEASVAPAPIQPTPPQDPIQPSAAPTNDLATPKKSGKWLMIPLIVGAVGLGGYALSKLGGAPTGADAQNTQDNNATASADTGNNATARADNANSYTAVVKSLPEAKSKITEAINNGADNGVLSKITGAGGRELYEKTLDLPPDLVNAVQQVAKQGAPELTALQNTAYTQEIETTKEQALNAFRKADMGYVADQPVNRALAKQFNESAKNYYWNKKDPKAALYLQAQAFKNSPMQGEYAANLAFYMVKANYPGAKDFVLYALQTPRDKNKYPNTYMIELASALAVKEGNEKAAVGALLTQYYTADDKDKRCQNMLRYPKTYPELVPVANQVLKIIEAQDREGISPAPDACLPNAPSDPAPPVDDNAQGNDSSTPDVASAAMTVDR